MNEWHDKNLFQPQIFVSSHSTSLWTGNIKTEFDINILFTHCSIWTKSQRKCTKIISLSSLMPIFVCIDKHVCMEGWIDGWMDAHIYVRKFVYIMNAYLETHVCNVRNYAKYIWNYVRVYIGTYVSMFIIYTYG